MSMIRRFTPLLAGALMCGTAATHAADSGFYIGAGTGQQTTTDNPQQLGGQSFDESSTPWRAFAGYRLGLIPIFDFAAEIGYRDIGKASANVGGTNTEYQMTGADAALLVIFPILGFDIFGKGGVIQYDLDKSFNGATSNFSGTAPMYGAGVGFRFWRLGIRAEYEYLDIDELSSAHVGMVSATFRF